MSEYLLMKGDAVAETCDRPEIMKRVLILYTGGTVGMKWSAENGYQPAYSYLEEKMKTFPSLCDQQYEVDIETHWTDMHPFSPIPLPCTFKGYRILYSIIEFNPLLDSSNLSMEDWATIAQNVGKYYHQFNGFVIVHGTDTMAYTASALSFMCDNLGKTIILTGSQVPISELRNDARDNILGSLILAGQYVIPEVCIYFHNKLYRGNRTTKLNSASFDAFSSPNLPPLAVVGIDISIEWDAIHRPSEIKRFCVLPEMDPNVAILRIFPGITQATIRSFLQPPIEGVVVQTYGAGNVPDTHSSLFQELKIACDRGVVVVNCTQCASGVVTKTYPGVIKLHQIGVVPGADMTTEAALTKLSFLLARKYDSKKIRELLQQNLHGELTVTSNQPRFSLRDSELLRAVAEALNISSSKEVKLLKQTLYAPLMCAAAAGGDIASLEAFHQQRGDFNLPDYDGRTPLHLACCEGHLDTVRYLLEHGASVHVCDRFNHTPLHNACSFKKHQVVSLLLEAGADLNSDCKQVMEVAGMMVEKTGTMNAT